MSGIIDAKFNVPEGEPLELVLTENKISFTGDSGKIKDTNDQLRFQFIGSKMSLTGRKKLTDAEGNEIALINAKHMSLRHGQYISRPDETRLAIVQPKSALQFKSHAEITYLAGCGVEDKDPDFSIEGSFRSKNFEITEISSGKVACNVSREGRNARNHLFGADTYIVTVHPGYDSAFFVCAVICLDEIFRDKVK